MKTPHKHAELIKAWADGAEIQYSKRGEYWVADDEMGWYEDYQYRIKQEPKPDVIHYASSVHLVSTVRREFDDIKLIVDGETGKLKSAEVIS